MVSGRPCGSGAAAGGGRQRRYARAGRRGPAAEVPAGGGEHGLRCGCCARLALSARQRHRQQSGLPAERRAVRHRRRGAVVRAGASLTSAVVGELDGGTVVVAAAAPDKTGRVAVHTPLQGFVSRKVLIPYGTGHAVPQQLKPKPIIDRTKTVTV